ncbi:MULTISPECIES: hypothetical protein [Streptomyces]|uniref:Uncharacterized protein n=1 Tax=Streptomyces chartreusis NRRL 3882 TaxID=1079985 RepID=A0A2N9BCU6_STRCX|nr:MULTISPECIES: hypothetical protein [Streptomyces]SOR81184.1 hypothetical protein SCNRRL3882_4636 [Streptomyces chartreusis NRRL 3882]
MTSDHSQRASRPVEAAPGLLVHPTTDRRLASEHWLLSTLPALLRHRARLEWKQHHVAMMPLGTLFSAVRIPSRLVVALAGSSEADCLDAFLAEALGGGPVISDPRFSRLYALVPARMSATLHQVADTWRALEVECLGRGSYLGVPRLDAVPREHAFACYWSVPMDSAAMLCSPLTVARLIAAGKHCLAMEPEA